MPVPSSSQFLLDHKKILRRTHMFSRVPCALNSQSSVHCCSLRRSVQKLFALLRIASVIIRRRSKKLGENLHRSGERKLRARNEVESETRRKLAAEAGNVICLQKKRRMKIVPKEITLNWSIYFVYTISVGLVISDERLISFSVCNWSSRTQGSSRLINYFLRWILKRTADENI